MHFIGIVSNWIIGALGWLYHKYQVQALQPHLTLQTVRHCLGLSGLSLGLAVTIFSVSLTVHFDFDQRQCCSVISCAQLESSLSCRLTLSSKTQNWLHLLINYSIKNFSLLCYILQRGCVFAFVCLSVSRITQKVDKFWYIFCSGVM